MKVYHNSRLEEYRKPLGAAQVSSKVRLALKIEPSYPGETLDIENVLLRCWHDELGELVFEMTGDGKFYTCDVSMPDKGCIVWYFFVINKASDDGYDTLFYGNNELNTGGEGCISDVQPPSFQITVYRHEPVPSWFKEGVVYQIFPDRFARDENWRERADAAIMQYGEGKGQKKIIEEDWYRPAYYVKDEEGNVLEWPFYGGSFKGIQGKLKYLKSLGVSVIYLNPISKASSNHRYDTADYMRPDPMLGSDEDFQNLAKAAEAEGISIILDGVFSHTGADSIYFDKYEKYGNGAFANEDSPYRDWFDFNTDDPVGYRSWWGIRDLPEVNEDNEDFVKLICGDGGVLEKWLRLGAKGWRLDVADELPDRFIQKIRTKIKSEGKDNLLLGEVWEDASNKESHGEKRKYFMGDELDSTMNYPVRSLILDFIHSNISAHIFQEKLLSLKENYPRENFYGAMNLIGSHDRQRIMTEMGAESNYDDAAKKVKMASVLQYALPGVPCIYYGDEAGMTGAADPENRNGFIWDKENTDTVAFFRQLGLIYKEHPVLKDGDIRMISDDVDVAGGKSNDILAFVREDAVKYRDEKIVVIVNRSNEVKPVSLKGVSDIKSAYALELLSSSEIGLVKGKMVDSISMEPLSVKIICLLKNAPERFKMKRCAGTICHVSSIPGGTLGTNARNFVDYLAEAGMGIWQILPLNPDGLGGSPYSSNAVFAGNTAFIDPLELPDMLEYSDFLEQNEYWLNDYAEYLVLKGCFDGDEWYKWPEKYRNKTYTNLAKEMGVDEIDDTLEAIKVNQYYFWYQWKELKAYANNRGIDILGDLPVFVGADSADVWANRDIFLMDENGGQKCHAGVPPDYFSPEGQDWGNPLYNWDALKKDGYGWWVKRLGQCKERYNYVRLDHFRSFSEFYSIPEGETPINGNWQNGPGLDFFRAVRSKYGKSLKILAEDLGQLDNGVANLLKLSGLPGMNVWQFSQYDMDNMSEEMILTRAFYSGTHDNQTLLGWVREQGGGPGEALKVIRRLYESGSPWAIIQLQDLFMLDDSCRMNVPGVARGNWTWKVTEDLSSVKNQKIAKAFKLLAEETGRTKDFSAEAFFKKHNMNFDKLDMESECDKMVAYYNDAISGGLIDATMDSTESPEGSVIAIDMGGTNVRVARIKIDNESEHPVSIERQIRKQTPGRAGRVTAAELFRDIASMIEFVDKRGDCRKVGFSFSFPIESDVETRDAKIKLWCKELEVIGGEGQFAGQLLNKALVETEQLKRDVVVINDTVAAYMAHRAHKVSDTCVAGFVLGTGQNICFKDMETGLIYNLESGRYDGFETGELDEILDAQSENPGSGKAEKMMSGVYLPRLVEIACAKAIEDGFISADLSKVSDKNMLADIEDIIVDRSAMLSAVTVAVGVKMATHGKVGNYSVVAEGSQFWKTEGLKERIERYTNQILGGDGIHITFIGIPDASLVGAAESV